jgi:hypothetical protein
MAEEKKCKINDLNNKIQLKEKQEPKRKCVDKYIGTL